MPSEKPPMRTRPTAKPIATTPKRSRTGFAASVSESEASIASLNVRRAGARRLGK